MATTATSNQDVPYVTVEIHRGNGTRRWVQTYRVPYLQRMNVLSLLHYIYEELDHSLAFRTVQCTRGICNVCQMRLNGKRIKACATPVLPGHYLVLEPSNQRVIRDLVTEQD